jgi:hypothetical protein
MTPTDTDEYDRYLDAFGARLHDAAAAGQPSRPRRRWLFGLSGGVVVAGAATAAILLAVGGGAAGPRLDAVAQAREALAPKGKIVHIVVRSRFLMGRLNVPVARTEMWTAASPLRWRLRQDLTKSNSGTFRDGRFVKLRGVQELSYGGGSQRTYSAQFDELRVQRGYSDRSLAVRPPSLLQLEGSDPADTLRLLLERGRLRDLGLRTTVSGRHVRRLVGVSHRTPTSTQTLTYDVDPDTFAPVQGTLVDAETRHGLPSRRTTFVVDRYQTFPDTPANAHLLRPATTPKTKVIIRSTAALRKDQAAQRAWRKRCRPMKRGGMKCPPPPVRLVPQLG